jgi:cytochrome c peroxidase
VVALALTVVTTATLGWLSPAADARGGAPLAPLDTMPVPTPTNIANFVQNNAAAVKLGKAFFWDMQAGSDGHQACASCHFNAGADNRSRNQLNPRQPTGAGFDFKGANAQLTAADFPFHKLSDPTDASSAVISDTSNVAGSQGVIPSKFLGVAPGQAADVQDFAGIDQLFQIGDVNVRRTTGRNTPSAINAVFNFRNFWDGRAQNEFNGVDPFGARETSARVGLVGADGTATPISLTDDAAAANGFTLNNSSLASQADGPPGNPVEMSSDGRTLSDIGKKLMSVRPLGEQQVSPSDSVLGSDIAPGGKGLNTSYADLIRAAFKPQWWNSDENLVAGNGSAYPLMQYNFGLYWGLAIQAYEATLVSDQAPVDRFLAGDPNAISPAAQQGMGIFNGQGKCSSCHGGPAFTEATAAEVAADGVAGTTVDTGFANIGVRPTGDDPGIGGADGTPTAGPLSEVPGGSQVQGSFKIPDLRNVALTAPYFHNGGQMTLRQVVDFYSRGGDFDNPQKDSDISPLNLSDAQKDNVVAFLESLTDPRVKAQSAPFDHPQLFVPVGEKTNGDGSIVTANGRAADCFKEVPATGAGGGAPLTPFPGFTGPPCSSFPAAPATVVTPVAPARPAAPKAPVQVPKAPVQTLQLGRLTLNRRLSLRALRIRGLRLTVSVPLNTRSLTLRLTRGGRTIATKKVSVRAGGRITVAWHPSKKVLRKLRSGRYRIVVFAAATARRTGNRIASARATLTR